MRSFISFIFMAVAAFYPAFASACSSIMDTKCDWEKALVITNDIEAEVNLGKKQEIDYPTKNCAKRKCVCEELAGSVEFYKNGKALDLINAQEKKRAENYKCDATKIFGRHRPQFVYTSNSVISIGSYNLNYIRDITKGCHGEHPFITYDTQTGEQYLLKDILLSDKIELLDDALVSGFYAIYGRQDADKEKDIKNNVKEYLEKNPVGNSGFIVGNGRIYLNIGTFAFGCSAGSFYPVEVPEQFINQEFLDKIKL